MFFLNVCGLNVQVNNIYEDFKKRSLEYIIEETKPDIILEATEEEISKEAVEDPRFSKGYHEGAVLFRKMCKEILRYNAFFFHSAVVSYKGKGYVFTGKSGSGKSTHAMLWREVFPDAVIINGDKPLIRREKDGFYAYGAPWNGKEGLHQNESVKIEGVFFIEQSKENSVKKLSPKEVLKKIFSRTNYIREPESNLLLIELLESFVTEVPFYQLLCDISREAVYTAYKTINPEDNNEY